MLRTESSSPIIQVPLTIQGQPVSSVESKLFQQAVNASAVSLYQELSKNRSVKDENFVFFVPNLLTSFSMLYAGAPAKLQGIIERALHMGELTQEKWHRNLNQWSQGIMHRSQELLNGTSQFHFQQVQMVASKNTAPLTQSAVANMSHYNAETLLFQDPQEAGDFVNKRVEEVTEGLIKDLVSKEDLTPDLILLMASAALFKGNWQYPFTESENSKETFYNSDGTETEVVMMNKDCDNLKMAHAYIRKQFSMGILELPFHGKISLLLIKPSSWDGDVKSQLKNFMTNENIEDLLNNYESRFRKQRGLSVGVPKLDLREKVDILDELKERSLSEGILSADFSGSLVESSQPVNTPKLVSEVCFKMDEKGAEVAGASYSPSYQESCDPSFKLDNSFGLAMVDRETNTLLCMGQILNMKPQEEK